MFYFDPLYLIFMIPAMILAGIATAKTKSAFSKYSRIASRTRLTGAQAARRMLDQNGLHDVEIRRARGFLSDHYNPANRTLNLSPDVYDSPSLSAIGVACHEAGHALQHAHGYVPLQIRSSLVPITQFSSYGAYLFILLGMFMQSMPIATAGVWLFAIGFVFALITLPVEWDASTRAKRQMVTDGIVLPSEANDAGKVLDAAFLTYVAAAVSALLTLLYYMMRLGLIGGRDD
ncbi:MAG: zinc metallopeptidase [Lentisphaerae bacterium]|jgi:Zn-dependent membrane protease YugP|nr:zinc metallopeptidase [Lentisphaerota bacterium]